MESLEPSIDQQIPYQEDEEPRGGSGSHRQPVPTAAAASGIFSFADRFDYLLMFFGSIGSCVHGAAIPIFFVLFGRLINSLGTLASHPHKLASEASKNALQLVYLGLMVLASAWIGMSYRRGVLDANWGEADSTFESEVHPVFHRYSTN